jgi:hypothetical protein
MPLKIMCAGCPKDERDAAENSVKAALGQAAGSWTVSLVKIGRQWSMTVDGPEVKHKTLAVPEGGIKQAIQELLPQAAPPARAPAPPTHGAPSAPAARPAAPVPGFSPSPAAPAPAPVAARAPQPTPPAPRAPLPPARSAPAAPPRTAPASPSRTPSPSPRPPTKAGERQDRYACEFCGGAFLVIYDAGASASQETVAVACPHCWKNSHVMVSEEAALTRDYRSEKA